VAYDWANKPGLTNTDVVTLGDWSQPPSATNNTDACSPLSPADATKVAGKVVMTMWLDGTGRRCGSAGRSGNAATGGAAGVIFGSDVNSFSAGVTGSEVIPAMLLVNQGTVAIKSQLDASTPVKVTMTNDLRNSVTIVNKGAVDQLAGFSSRGIGVANNVKPDVAAPGVTTFSVAVGTGNEGIAESGTSMASPHVAGEAALVRGAHSTWSVEEVKAAIMNTATQDVFVGENHTGAVYGPERVGSGRVKVDDAVGTSTLAYSKDTPGAVSVSFGPVAVTAPTTTLTKTVKVVNKRPTGSAAYTISYKAAHTTPGVTYSFSPSQVNLAAGASVDVKVTATITKANLRVAQDPTTSPDPLDLGLQRSFRTDASGRMVLTPVGTTPGGALRVPVWSAPRPASVMSSSGNATVSSASASSSVKWGNLTLTGTGVDQGGASGYQSSVSAVELQGMSSKMASCSSTVATNCIAFADDRSADLRYVGAGSDYNMAGNLDDSTLTFAVNSWGPWRTPASYTEFDVLLETDATNAGPDAAVYNTRVSTTDDYDYFLSELVDLRKSSDTYGEVLDDQLINGIDGSFDTNVFNSDSLVLPVSLGVLTDAGLVKDASTKLNYWVESYTAEAGAVDKIGSSSAPMTISVGSPALSAFGDYWTLLNTDLPGQVLRIRRNDAAYATDKPIGLMLVHHLNTDGLRSQVVRVKAATTTALAANDRDFGYGYRPTLTATVVPSLATGTVTFMDGTRTLGAATVKGGKAVFTAPVLARGTHSLKAVYGGSTVYLASTSAALSVVVR
jgi:hypothetical protein